MKKALLICAVASISACAASPEQQARIALAEQSVPVCTGQADCQAKWDAAQLWVSNNSAYRLQIVTDVVIETYPAMNYSTGLAMRVTREPIPDGRQRINLTSYCDNLISCSPNPVEAKIQFNEYVSSIEPMGE